MATETTTPLREVNESDLNGEDGLEKEEGIDKDEITVPFDPELIKITTTPLLVAQLILRIDDDALDRFPEFQRHPHIWDSLRKSRLIESLLLRIPIPVFYVVADANDDWSVVDGLQRMTTIYDYVKGRFALSKLESLMWLNGKKYTDLPRKLQRRISETQLHFNVIEPGTPPEVKFNVFVRINSGGVKLNAQEMRHALHPGKVRTLLVDLSKTEEFLKATADSISPTRMADQECILRFLAFYINQPENYDARSLDGFLSRVMDTINGMTDAERGKLTSDFKRAMLAAYKIFGDYAFRRREHAQDRKHPISKALFETWSVHLARCSDNQIQRLIAHRKPIQYKFSQLLIEDEAFNRAISYSTGSHANVRRRFEAIGRLVQEFR